MTHPTRGANQQKKEVHGADACKQHQVLCPPFLKNNGGVPVELSGGACEDVSNLAAQSRCKTINCFCVVPGQCAGEDLQGETVSATLKRWHLVSTRIVPKECAVDHASSAELVRTKLSDLRTDTLVCALQVQQRCVIFILLWKSSVSAVTGIVFVCERCCILLKSTSRQSSCHTSLESPCFSCFSHA